MLYPRFLVTVVVLASAATAFFPMEDRRAASASKATLKLVQRAPKHDLPHGVQIRRLAQRLGAKYRRGTPVQPIEVHKRDDLAKRDNTYSILPAATPTQPMSAGIDQDGTDFSYFTEVMIGSSNAPVYLLLDTGASHTWVMGKSCISKSCQAHDLYDPASSNSYRDTGTTFNISYGSGQVVGVFGEDKISFAGLTLSMTLGIANTASDEFSSFPIDGILGLSQSRQDSPVFTEALVASKKLESNVFGISINRAADGANDGEINFGAPNTARYDGSLSYNAVSESGDGNWAIPLANVGFGKSQSNISGRSAYIDTGTSFIFCPQEDAEIFHALVPGADSKDNTTYTIPCDTSTFLTFTFGDRTYSVDPKDWISPEIDGVCSSYVHGEAVVPGNWLLGDTFLKNVYSLFDVDQNRIGALCSEKECRGYFYDSVVNINFYCSIGTKSTSSTSASATADSTPTSGPQIHENPSSGAPDVQTKSSAALPSATPSEKSDASQLLSDLLPGAFVIILIALVA
ncbi:aspartic proteinase [Marssonina coronariae]|uniref:Aspartic proteinase n=1 Tax=Diplocarpon coronariae TaxID=2795749 RepID=A0A218ZEB3_9HELO|nr:aspartic proteinase [Marssonina coronariae]